MSRRIPGVVVGVVVDREDPEGQGRIRVQYPWLDESTHSPWAPIAVPMAGGDRGTFYMPELDDEVLVAFEHGDFDHPFVVGFLWNGQDQPPTTDNSRRLFRSVNRHEIEMYDSDGSGGNPGYIRIKDAMGNTVELSNAKISITGVGMIEIQAPSVLINQRPVVPTPGRPI